MTIDAIGTQREIAAQIIDAGADYTLALKANQPSLHADVVAAFADTTVSVADSHSTRDRGHGRLEARDYFVITDVEDIQKKHNWPGLESIGMVKSIRVGDGRIGEELRYFVNSYSDGAQRFARAVRQHWTVENNLHWSLDVSAFAEDSCRVRRNHAPENLAVLRRISLNMHKNDPAKGSMRTKQMRCLLDQERILKLLIL